MTETLHIDVPIPDDVLAATDRDTLASEAAKIVLDVLVSRMTRHNALQRALHAAYAFGQINADPAKVSGLQRQLEREL